MIAKAIMQPNEMAIWGITLPTVVAAALMGSALTLLGVFFQNLFENFRNNKRLKHETAQKSREREMALKREVYLEAASEMTKAARFVAKFGDLNLSFAEHQAIVGNFDAAMSKIHMVARMEALKKVIEVSDAFTRANFELNQLRFPLLLDKKDMEQQQKVLEDLIAQQKNLVTRIGQLQAANQNHPEISELSATFQNLEIQIRNSRKRYSELNARTVVAQLQLSSAVFKQTLSFAKHLIEVTIVLRKELDFDLKGDEESYKKFVHQSQEKAVEGMNNYIAELAKTVASKESGSQPSKGS